MPLPHSLLRGTLTRRVLQQRSGTGMLGLSALEFLGRGPDAHAAEAAVPDAAGTYVRDPVWSKVTYGPWGGPGANPGPRPMDAITAHDYAPVDSLVLEQHQPPKARFPAIDVHAHIMPGLVWWRYYGLDLAPAVLEALYRGKARAVLPAT